jgi:hypothetical protein
MLFFLRGQFRGRHAGVGRHPVALRFLRKTLDPGLRRGDSSRIGGNSLSIGGDSSIIGGDSSIIGGDSSTISGD